MLAWASTLLPAEWTSTPWHPLLACALFIVPGVPLINFVDDMLDNYIQVGIVQGSEYVADGIGNGFRYCFCRETVQHR